MAWIHGRARRVWDVSAPLPVSTTRIPPSPMPNVEIGLESPITTTTWVQIWMSAWSPQSFFHNMDRVGMLLRVLFLYPPTHPPALQPLRLWALIFLLLSLMLLSYLIRFLARQRTLNLISSFWIGTVSLHWRQHCLPSLIQPRLQQLLVSIVLSPGRVVLLAILSRWHTCLCLHIFSPWGQRSPRRLTRLPSLSVGLLSPKSPQDWSPANHHLMCPCLIPPLPLHMPLL